MSISTNMAAIYFEKQEGRLCAQHCLNALLQGQYFTPVDLAKIAQDLDEEEKRTMGESGVDTAEYRAFIKQPSANLDDSGYFSVQVISRCLSIWGLDMVPFQSSAESAVMAQRQPETFNAYICNYKDHWFCVRKINNQWYNLNSISKGPTLISDTYLGLFLAQLHQEGYSIFLVLGDLPQCEADYILSSSPVKSGLAAPPSSPSNVELLSKGPAGVTQEAVIGSLNKAIDDREDCDLKRAIQLSLNSPRNDDPNNYAGCSKSLIQSPQINDEDMDDDQLEAALKLSMECMEVGSSDSPP